MLFDLKWKSKKVDRPKVMCICDVSGSVSNYSRFLLMFLYKMRNHFLETWVANGLGVVGGQPETGGGQRAAGGSLGGPPGTDQRVTLLDKVRSKRLHEINPL